VAAVAIAQISGVPLLGIAPMSYGVVAALRVRLSPLPRAIVSTYVGTLIWLWKIQSASNVFWATKGAPRAGGAAQAAAA
jgi:hypothetical protein